MTQRLYYTDAYLSSFDAVVREIADGGRRVYLDRTAFYPTSGGQPHDTGTLGGERVVDVVDEGNRIAHVLESPLTVPVDTPVHGRIDWARRYDHMQQHTGQHLLSAVFADLFGLETVSVHFGARSSTLDLASESVSPEQILEAERRANELVWEARPVEVSFEDAATATGLRKPPAREGEIRVITIQGVDRSACGGTHVRTMAEIGPILLRGTERIRRETRIEFYCGGRALARARADHELLGRAAQLLSTSPEEVPTLVAAQRDQIRELASTRRRLGEELAGYRARELYRATEPGPAGVRLAVARRPERTVEELRALAHAFTAHPRAVLVATLAAPPTLLLAASDDAGIDAGAMLRQALAEVGGRGGGNARIAQGTAPSAGALDRAVAILAALTAPENPGPTPPQGA